MQKPNVCVTAFVHKDGKILWRVFSKILPVKAVDYPDSILYMTNEWSIFETPHRKDAFEVGMQCSLACRTNEQ